MTDETEQQPVSKKSRYIGLSILAAMVIISIVGSVLLVLNFKYISELENQGLLGLFVISIFAGSPIPIPTPSMILTFTMGSILNPVFVGLVSGLGNGLGNALIFWMGRGGHMFFRSILAPPTPENEPRSRTGRFFRRLMLPAFTRDRVLVAVFLLSIYPNPVLTPLILSLGVRRYNFTKFFLACLGGKVVQSMILASLGFFGLRSLMRYMGIFQLP